MKTREGAQHPDRDAQFRYINRVAKRAVAAGEPVISVDTKKKELVGDFHNAGREWRPKGEPELVRVHDFKDTELGKVIPYGVYDISADQGWVNVGIDHDTAQFAVNSIGSWWSTSASHATRTPPGFRSPPTAADRTAIARGCGRWSCKGWPMKPSWR